MSCKNGGTHHHACDCREEFFARIVRENKKLGYLVDIGVHDIRRGRELAEKVNEATEVLKQYAGYKGADWGLRDDGEVARALLKKWGVE